MSVSQTSVKSDGSDFSTVTATVINGNITQSGAAVSFRTTCGLLSTGSQVTDSNGQCKTTFKSNPANPANQSCDITATYGGSTSTIPVTITGTTVTLSADKSSLPPGESTNLLISVKDAGGVGIHNAPVTISSSTGAVTLPSSGTTVSGNLSVTLNAITTGTSRITVTSMGASSTLDCTVISATANIQITSPATSPITITTLTPAQAITVSGPNGTSVRFVTTLGAWDGGANSSVTKIIAGGVATANLASAAPGLATVQVYDVADPTNADSMFVNFSPPPSQAEQVAISFSKSSVAPSTATLKNTITVYAKVVNVNAQPIANVPVDFKLTDTTGGGEYISPVSSLTDSSGYATTTFTAGTSSSGGLGVTVTATEQGSGVGHSDFGSVLIGGTPASVVVGRSTLATNSSDSTFYTMSMSVLVTDSSGVAMPNVPVSLSAWPTRYRLGYLEDGNVIIEPVPAGNGVYSGLMSMLNEDVDRDGFLTATEDVGPCFDLTACTNLAADGQVTPASAASGSVFPGTVTTGSNGIGSFTLTYLKKSAIWVETQITARIEVAGTESSGKWTSWLPALTSDFPYLEPSPYGYYYSAP